MSVARVRRRLKGPAGRLEAVQEAAEDWKREAGSDSVVGEVVLMTIANIDDTPEVVLDVIAHNLAELESTPEQIVHAVNSLKKLLAQDRHGTLNHFSNHGRVVHEKTFHDYFPFLFHLVIKMVLIFQGFIIITVLIDAFGCAQKEIPARPQQRGKF
mgnify:CR=1 FL=1